MRLVRSAPVARMKSLAQSANPASKGENQDGASIDASDRYRFCTMTTEARKAGRLPLSARRPSAWRSILMFLSVIGPGIITANADNDVGGITVYSLAGAQFGYSLLWLLI